MNEITEEILMTVAELNEIEDRFVENMSEFASGFGGPNSQSAKQREYLIRYDIPRLLIQLRRLIDPQTPLTQTDTLGEPQPANAEYFRNWPEQMQEPVNPTSPDEPAAQSDNA